MNPIFEPVIEFRDMFERMVNTYTETNLAMPVPKQQELLEALNKIIINDTTRRVRLKRKKLEQKLKKAKK